LKKSGLKLNIAVVHGGAAIKRMFEILDSGKKQYHFIEFMACPGGCVNGGGMPITNDLSVEEVVKLRAQSLYDQDAQDTEYRKSHESPAIKKVYEEFLETPNSHKAHTYCHTHYTQKSFTKE
jgi:NADP-reducing hydrogenase subunit HndD